MANLFEAAVRDSALLTEIVDAMKNVTRSDDPLILQNPAFRAAVLTQLSRIASAHGLDFEPDAPASASRAAALLTAMEKIQKDNPTLPPIALLFISAALMFAPSVFKTVGGTIFGIDTIVGAVEGIEAFGGR